MMNNELKNLVMRILDEAQDHWQHGRVDAARRRYEEAVNLWEEDAQDRAFTPYIAAVERLRDIYQSKLAELLVA